MKVDVQCEDRVVASNTGQARATHLLKFDSAGPTRNSDASTTNSDDDDNDDDDDDDERSLSHITQIQ
jgi:hypothetical protein